MPDEVPHGRLLALHWMQTDHPESPTGAINVLRITFRAPDGETYHFDLPNGGWQLQNVALQFLAKWNYKPSDWDHDATRYDAEPDQVLIPVAEHPPTDQWFLHEEAMSGSESALREATWFGSGEAEEGDSGQSDGPHGGASDGDGGGGAAAKVGGDEEGGISVELADEESDQGVSITIS